MSPVFAFGERIAGYEVPVLNEREARASAGILFLFALVSFMNAWLTGDFRFTRVFVVAFLIDFTLRIFINPRYSPSLILGRFAVRWQTPEYVGAPQKRFAWAIGWLLAMTMLYLVVIERVIGPLNLIVCVTCLVLLFFEAAFGICLGCKIYNLFSRQTAQHCPGGVCEVRAPLRIGAVQLGVMALFFAALYGAGYALLNDPRDLQFLAKQTAAATQAPAAPAPAANAADCTPPDWAVKMGHAEQWKLHHNCK
jgi:hypothetical protein